MMILLKRPFVIIGFCTFLFNAIPIASPQTTLVYPGASIYLLSVKEFNGQSFGCPQGGTLNGFLRLISANGWTSRSSLTAQIRDGNGTVIETNRKSYSFTTVHPGSRRLRHWSVIETETISRALVNKREVTCELYAMLEGDFVGDSEVIDIGVLVSDKLKEWERVAPIRIIPPFYCNKNWIIQDKGSLNQRSESFDCSSVGISIPANDVQTNNLAK